MVRIKRRESWILSKIMFILILLNKFSFFIKLKKSLKTKEFVLENGKRLFYELCGPYFPFGLIFPSNNCEQKKEVWNWIEETFSFCNIKFGNKKEMNVHRLKKRKYNKNNDNKFIHIKEV